MAKQASKQKLANLIQIYEQAIIVLNQLKNDSDLADWQTEESKIIDERISSSKTQLKDIFDIDYDSDEAKTQIIKEGSEVEVLVNHMEGMKGGTATIYTYSLPANFSDIVMKDGMEMNNHKWLTNNEVKLK